MISGGEFANLLEGHGFDFFAGVPCSLIEDLIAVLEDHPRLPYVAAVREDVAVGLAAGAWLGGKRPGGSHAELRTRHEPQRPGLAGSDVRAAVAAGGDVARPRRPGRARAHPDGRDLAERCSTSSASRIAWSSTASLEADLAWAVAEMDARMQPVALLVPPGVVETGHAHGLAREAVCRSTSSLRGQLLRKARARSHSGRPASRGWPRSAPP